MPRRNIIKQNAPDAYYHLYARGISRGKIFTDAEDYDTFLKLLSRYLSAEEAHDAYGISYPNFYNKLELLAYCLMPNHFHMFVYQRQLAAITGLTRSVLASYSRYYNKKYHRSGPLFESTYRASLISDDSYLQHISRYIHLNPRQWRTYPYSSLQYYLQRSEDTWIRPNRILELFTSEQDYIHFLEDYIGQKQMLDILKYELANDITV